MLELGCEEAGSHSRRPAVAQEDVGHFLGRNLSVTIYKLNGRSLLAVLIVPSRTGFRLAAQTAQREEHHRISPLPASGSTRRPPKWVWTPRN